MKHFIRMTAVILLAAVTVVPIVFAGQPSGSEEMTEPLTLMHDKGGEVGWNAPIERMSALYVAANGGPGFEPVDFPSTDAFRTALRASLSSNDPTALFSWWAGKNMDELVNSGFVADLSSVWDKYSDEYSPGLRTAYMVGDKTYAIPAGIAYWVMFYNTKVFDDLGLEPPTTWDELLAVCETLKNNGIIPMGQSVQGAWPPMIQFMEFLVRVDPDFYEALMDGRAKYTDPAVAEAFAVWKQLMDNGYFSDPSTDLFSEFPRLFADGQAAMIDMGTWYTGVLGSAGLTMGEDYDFFLIPSIRPSAGPVVIYEATPILVAENSPYKAEALKIAEWWMSAEAQSEWGKQIGQFPSNTTSDVSFLDPSLQNLMQKITDGNYRQVNRYYEATLPDIANDALAQFGAFVMAPDTASDVMASLDSIAEQAWAENK